MKRLDVGETTVDKMTVDKMPIDKMHISEMSLDKMTHWPSFDPSCLSTTRFCGKF